MKNTTLCYIERDGKYLMLHRVKEKNDANRDKWIGVGGHFEERESPYDCILREIREETALEFSREDMEYRGIVTFVSDEYETEYMHLFTVSKVPDDYTPPECDEGVLEWISKEKLLSLPMWEGDMIFLKLLDDEKRFFHLKLVYSGDKLMSHSLDFGGKPNEKEPILISACLLGAKCRYDGKSKPLSDEKIEELDRRYTLIPVCPEQLGGLPTPRLPCEIQGGRVIRKDGVDVSESYLRGAEETLRLLRLFGIKKALLKAKSPSCGAGKIYNGSFSGTLTDGDGITAALLKANGVEVLSEDDI